MTDDSPIFDGMREPGGQPFRILASSRPVVVQPKPRVNASAPSPADSDLVAWAYSTGRVGLQTADGLILRLGVPNLRAGALAAITAAKPGTPVAAPVDMFADTKVATRLRVYAKADATRSSTKVTATKRTVRAAAPAVQGGPFGRNPVVAEMRSSHPDLVTLAEAEGPAPTLFESGDLPDFTASGIDPQLLLKLPWQARHPVASAATQAVAYQLFAAYIDNVDGARIDAVCTADDGIVDYVERVSMWLAATGPKPAASIPLAAAALVAEDQSLDRLVDDLFDTPSERARVAEQQQARTDRAAVKASANAAKEVQAQARRTAVEAQRRRDHIAAARGGDPLLRPW